MPVATETGGGEFQLPPTGMHVARCCQVIDLGTQRDEFQGKPKLIHKVRIAWELPEEKATFDETRGEEPFICSAEYTLSLNERANLRHMLESWRGKEFNTEELKGFELGKLIGKPCMVNIIHKKSQNKRNYAIVSTVTPLPKGTKCPKATLETLCYNIEDGPNEVFKKLPEWIRDKILASEEVTNPSDSEKDVEQKAPPADDDEIPF